MEDPSDTQPAIDPARLSGPAWRAFVRIAEYWGLSVEEQLTILGLTEPATYSRWMKDPNIILPRDALERISYVLGIYKALQTLIPDSVAADAWVKRPNLAPMFAGRSALDRMLGGQMSDLLVVRDYLGSSSGGWA